MFEKVNPFHPDKVADRIAGAIVDIAYKKADFPKIAVEVLIGHRQCNIIVETSEDITPMDCHGVVMRIAGSMPVYSRIVSQDEHLAKNQKDGIKCGDNGIFKGVPVTAEQETLKGIAKVLTEKYSSDGKYIINDKNVIICQSNANAIDIAKVLGEEYNLTINPLGSWTGGLNVDTGATNRKLGSDMGDAVTGGGLHGKDLSKADVTLNIVCHMLAQERHLPVTASCAIGDSFITFNVGEKDKVTLMYDKCVQLAGEYLDEFFEGSFERFAEWGLI